MQNHPQTSPASLKRQNVQLYRIVLLQRDIFPVKHVKALQSAANQNQPTFFSGSIRKDQRSIDHSRTVSKVTD